jgi:hypothetical protein
VVGGARPGGGGDPGRERGRHPDHGEGGGEHAATPGTGRRQADERHLIPFLSPLPAHRRVGDPSL